MDYRQIRSQLKALSQAGYTVQEVIDAMQTDCVKESQTLFDSITSIVIDDYNRNKK